MGVSRNIFSTVWRYTGPCKRCSPLLAPSFAPLLAPSCVDAVHHHEDVNAPNIARVNGSTCKADPPPYVDDISCNTSTCSRNTRQSCSGVNRRKTSCCERDEEADLNGTDGAGPNRSLLSAHSRFHSRTTAPLLTTIRT